MAPEGAGSERGGRPAGGFLPCAGARLSADGLRTRVRVNATVAEEAARRLGTLALLTAVTLVGMTLLKHVLQPELAAAHQTALFRVTAAALLAASLAVAVLDRRKLVQPQTLLDLGLGFEVIGAFVIGVMENSLAWPDLPLRGASMIAVWMAVCVFVVPNRPGRSLTAALLCAAMAPLTHLLCAHVLGYPALPGNRLATYTLTPLFIAGRTPFISTRMYQMQQDLSRAADLGSYHLESLLGKGGMGEVWRARHRLLRREAAVKLVRQDLPSRYGARELRHMRQRFEREAQAIASLRSPHTIALYDFGVSDDGSLYYAMELLDGLDAQALVEQYGPQPAGKVLALLRQACDSLAEAHDLGMVHRDIKPTNLFICRLGKQIDFLKVLDFGLVKAVVDSGQTELTQYGDTSGTPAFMAPEQARGELDIDSRADVYGLGCVAYFLLTGELVFNKPNAMAMAMAHAAQTPVPPSERSELPIPASLERVILACLEKRPEQRPRSASELACLLEKCTDVPAWTQPEAKRWWDLNHPAVAKEVLV